MNVNVNYESNLMQKINYLFRSWGFHLLCLDFHLEDVTPRTGTVI